MFLSARTRSNGRKKKYCLDLAENALETHSNGKEEMKPNKEICKKCYEKKFGWSWDWHNEERWRKGFQACSKSECNIGLSKGVPDDCPYALEHIVLGKRDEA